VKGQGWTEALGEGVKVCRDRGGLKRVVRALKGEGTGVD
jgi:hypothetical protein